MINTIRLKKVILLLSFTIILSMSFLFSNCSQARIERRTISTEKLKTYSFNEDLPFIKLHMRNGEAFILSNWEFEKQNELVMGKGKHLDINRAVIDTGDYSIHFSDIALVETNKINSSAPLLALSIMTGVSLAVTTFCIINPKACFGSCPTFYVCDGNDYKLQAEGFSSSVSPSLEAEDIDALYKIKPESNILDVQVRNEALETHIIRHANILALPKPKRGRILSTPDGKYMEAINISGLKYASGMEGDCTNKLQFLDGEERYSEADSNNLAQYETIDLVFENFSNNNKGLIIACRQTLLSTFLFYQSLAFMGRNAGFYFSQLEREGSKLKNFIKYPGELLKNIEVLEQDSSGEWVKINQAGETGPIAADIKIIPLKEKYSGKEIKIRLRMTRGMWRIDYAALADLGKEVSPLIIKPSGTFPEEVNGSYVLNLLNNEDSLLVTLPGDKYNIFYKLPENFKDYEYFLDSKGYYLEWLREVWLAEENPAMISEMIFNTNQYFRDLAPQYKKIEADMEKAFWRSKYVNP